MRDFIFLNIKKYKGNITSISISILAIGFIRQLFPVLFGNLVQSMAGVLVLKKVLGIVICYSCLFVCAQLLHIIENISHADLFNNMLVDIRRSCFDRFLYAKRKEIIKRSTGEILTIINEDVDKILDFISNCVINSISMTVELVFIVIFTTIINPYIAIYIIGSIGLSFLLSKKAGKIVETLYVLQRKYKSDLISFVIDFLEGRKEIFFMNAFSKAMDMYSERKAKQLDIEYKIITKTIIVERINALVNLICNIGLMLLSYYFVTHERMTTGNYITCALYFETALAMMEFYGYLAHAIPESKVSIGRVVDFLNLEEEGNGIKTIESIKKIELSECSFAYEDNNYSTNSINISIDNKGLILLSGESGAGKTTLLKCLIGLLDDYSGIIRFNNIDLRDINKQKIGKRMSVYLQGAELIDGETIRDNLCMGEKLTEDKIRKVLDLVNMSEYIEQLPYGLDTIFSTEETGISGGQKQRLLLARTLIKDADVYIFDEPTASLDIENEKYFIRILTKLKTNKIVFITSHRNEFKSIADYVLEVKKVEQ